MMQHAKAFRMTKGAQCKQRPLGRRGGGTARGQDAGPITQADWFGSEGVTQRMGRTSRQIGRQGPAKTPQSIPSIQKSHFAPGRWQAVRFLYGSAGEIAKAGRRLGDSLHKTPGQKRADFNVEIDRARNLRQPIQKSRYCPRKWHLARFLD